MVNDFKLKEGDTVIRKKLPHNFISNEWWSSRGGDFTSLYKVIEVKSYGIQVKNLRNDKVIVGYCDDTSRVWNKVEIKIDKIW